MRFVLCRVATDAHARFGEVNGDFQTPGCCVRAARELELWLMTTHPSVACAPKDMHLVAWNQKMNAPCSAPPIFKHPSGDTYVPEASSKRINATFVMHPDSCTWTADPKTTTNAATVYAHTVMSLGDIFLDWGFDQFILPEGVVLRLAVCE